LSHWLAYRLGQISLREARILQGYKNTGNTDEYESLEKRLGATRKQLEKKYSKDEIEIASRYLPVARMPYQPTFRTNRRTRKKYPVHNAPKSIMDTGVDDIL